ncbi:MAG: hypothetical protein E7J35_05365 [Veillonella sp.]|uniref:hypothetical protein n=1 Tax=Veillonella sp. TaxID=1926307 RepID=UPI002908A34F|nr:hypothetical protein [Veillonella sp.]MDU7927966.1 hypothetical protein [Veillonella sp.]MDU7955020.1 hypothetical protein [Clostridium perfringens]MDU7962767.1 hypothetical protein [Clostridium perfringens]
MSDFWGDFTPKVIQTPSAILNEIADELSTITNKFVYVEVKQFKENIYDEFGFVIAGYKFSFSFTIKSKYMDNYSFNAFSIHHDIISYPVTIKIDSVIENSIIEEIRSFYNPNGEGELIVESEDEFKNLIKIILQSNKLREIINMLYSISKEYENNF